MSIKQLLTALTSVTRENERAGPLVAAEIFNDALRALLSAKLDERNVDNETRNALLNGFGPLSTFAARISICGIFSLIPEREWRALHAMRKIRNHCAHYPAVASLKDPEIKTQVHVLGEYLTPGKRRLNKKKVIREATWQLYFAISDAENALVKKMKKRRRKVGDKPSIKR